MKLIVVIALLLIVECRAADDVSGIVNKIVNTALDLTSHLAKFTVSVTLENKGDQSVAHVLYFIDPMLVDHLAFINVECEGRQLEVVEHITPGKKENHVMQITLQQALSPGATTKLKVTVVFSHVVQPYPRHISQADKQLVQFTASGVYYLSAYPTLTQTLTVTLPTSTNIESFSRIKPVAADGSQIVYGPYADIKAFTSGAPRSLVIHYENNSPFMAVTNLDRLIEVSHWGNIAVEETVQILQTGAILKGPFSRYDYQRNPNSGQSSVKSYKSLLPAASTDVYYRDEIGNISTSHMRVDEDTVEVELRPRFPLFGGWQTKYTIGYNVPGYEYLWHDGSHFLLKMRVVDHIFDEQLVDHMTLRIILPEGAQNIKFKAPYLMDNERRMVHHTYLDTIGRPVVVINKNNLVEQHIADFELSYDFQLYLLLQEPLLVVTALLMLFLTVIICVRLDFSIAEDKAELSRQQASVMLDNIRSQHDNRMSAANRCDHIITSYKASKDQKKFRAAGRDVQNRYNEATANITNFQKELTGLDPDNVAKVMELQKKAGELWTILQSLLTLTEQVLTENMKKDSYVEQERKAQDKRQKVTEEIEAIVRGLY